MQTSYNMYTLQGVHSVAVHVWQQYILASIGMLSLHVVVLVYWTSVQGEGTVTVNKRELFRALRSGETECEACPCANKEDMADYLLRLQGIRGMWEEGRGSYSPHYIQ